MRILFIVLLTFAVNAGFVPPHAIARFCGNVVIEAKYKRIWKQQIQRQGCEQVVFVPLENDYFLVYGVKVLTSENANH